MVSNGQHDGRSTTQIYTFVQVQHFLLFVFNLLQRMGYFHFRYSRVPLYGMSFVRIFETIDRVITAPHCITNIRK